MFEIAARPNGWFVSYGSVEFGPYETQALSLKRAVQLTQEPDRLAELMRSAPQPAAGEERHASA